MVFYIIQEYNKNQKRWKLPNYSQGEFARTIRYAEYLLLTAEGMNPGSKFRIRKYRRFEGCIVK